MGNQIIKPAALARGDTIGVLAPAAAVERDYLERGLKTLAAMGYRVKVSDHALDRSGILAGTDEVRAGELVRFFDDPQIKAIIAARGGYGSGRLLPLIDFAKIGAAPKIFLGYSDETFLLNALVSHAGMVAFHGPMVAMDFARGLSEAAKIHLSRLFAGAGTAPVITASETIRPGLARGPLIGGCLSVIVAMLGTPWEPLFDGRILFLEDTGEKAYRIDRMLTQLRQAGVLRRVAGVVFGAIHPVNGSASERALITEFVAEQTADLQCPVLRGLEAGHGTDNFALPLGIEVELDSVNCRLAFSEPAVMTK